MGTPVSPLLGFNNNVKHRGKIFHIQTEDSGVKYPHIVTHLFADGGRIVKSTKTDYAEHLDRPDMIPLLRKMMKEQHKAMFIALRDGSLDHLIFPDESGEAPAQPEMAAQPPLNIDGELRQKPPPNELARMVPVQPAASPASSEEAQAGAGGPGLARPTPMIGTPERAAYESARESARYAATRPAAIFGATPDQESLFGGASISEQSLDEVILSYLSEELDESAVGE